MNLCHCELFDYEFQFIFRDILPDAVESNSFRFAIVKRDKFSNIDEKDYCTRREIQLKLEFHVRELHMFTTSAITKTGYLSKNRCFLVNFVDCERKTKATDIN